MVLTELADEGYIPMKDTLRFPGVIMHKKDNLTPFFLTLYFRLKAAYPRIDTQLS
jgi:hypothetical protein